MNLDDALKTFVIESRELLEGMEEALLRVEQSPDDADLICRVFNPTSAPASGEIRCARRLAAATWTNMNEEPLAEAVHTDHTVAVELAPKQIRTVALKLTE